ncbi:MAG: hypothetical protein M3371_05665 [Acidobacteriota bacterium]|nr:hypothetical protein [Acidobacteriota bacterium]
MAQSGERAASPRVRQGRGLAPSLTVGLAAPLSTLNHYRNLNPGERLIPHQYAEARLLNFMALTFKGGG